MRRKSGRSSSVLLVARCPAGGRGRQCGQVEGHAMPACEPRGACSADMLKCWMRSAAALCSSGACTCVHSRPLAAPQQPCQLFGAACSDARQPVPASPQVPTLGVVAAAHHHRDAPLLFQLLQRYQPKQAPWVSTQTDKVHTCWSLGATATARPRATQQNRRWQHPPGACCAL